MLPNNFAVYDAHGEIIKLGHVDPQDIPLQGQGPGEFLYVGEATFEDRVDPATGALLTGAKGVAPSPFHVWDAVGGVWVADLGQAKASKTKEIERERDRRMREPIAYLGSMFDADTRAQKNIADKLASIAQREALDRPLPAELLFWRDADNQMHTFADQAGYRAWLGGLAVVIEERATRAYAWSWELKAQLETLTTVEGVQALSVE
jgi:hypothetical protein